MNPVSYKQTDPRWGSKDYSAPGESNTIGKAGCGPSCMAMVIATLADAKITPADTAAWALKNGYKAKNQGTYYTYFVPQGKAYGLEVSRVNTANLKEVSRRDQHHAAALEAVKNGDLVICCMGPGLWTKSGHYILWHGTEGNQVLINDPGSSAPGRAKAPLATLQAQVKYYWVIKNPGKDDEDMKKIKAVINGKAVVAYLDTDGTSYIPARAVAEGLGANVSWDSKTETVTIKGRV